MWRRHTHTRPPPLLQSMQPISACLISICSQFKILLNGVLPPSLQMGWFGKGKVVFFCLKRSKWEGWSFIRSLVLVLFVSADSWQYELNPFFDKMTKDFLFPAIKTINLKKIQIFIKIFFKIFFKNFFFKIFFKKF